jgi:hypothetical protein
MWNNLQIRELITKVLTYYNADENFVDLVSIEALLNESGLNPVTLRGLRSALQLNDLVNEQNLDECINPIKIRFK